jgi:hypothetical protein
MNEIDYEKLRQDAIDICPEDERLGVMLLILAELKRQNV